MASYVLCLPVSEQEVLCHREFRNIPETKVLFDLCCLTVRPNFIYEIKFGPFNGFITKFYISKRPNTHR